MRLEIQEGDIGFVRIRPGRVARTLHLPPEILVDVDENDEPLALEIVGYSVTPQESIRAACLESGIPYEQIEFPPCAGTAKAATQASNKTIRILYHQEPDGWWAESPDLPGWSAAADSREELAQLSFEGARFCLPGCTVVALTQPAWDVAI